MDNKAMNQSGAGEGWEDPNILKVYVTQEVVRWLPLLR